MCRPRQAGGSPGRLAAAKVWTGSHRLSATVHTSRPHQPNHRRSEAGLTGRPSALLAGATSSGRVGVVAASPASKARLPHRALGPDCSGPGACLAGHPWVFGVGRLPPVDRAQGTRRPGGPEVALATGQPEGTHPRHPLIGRFTGHRWPDIAQLMCFAWVVWLPVSKGFILYPALAVIAGTSILIILRDRIRLTPRGR